MLDSVIKILKWLLAYFLELYNGFSWPIFFLVFLFVFKSSIEKLFIYLINIKNATFQGVSYKINEAYFSSENQFKREKVNSFSWWKSKKKEKYTIDSRQGLEKEFSNQLEDDLDIKETNEEHNQKEIKDEIISNDTSTKVNFSSELELAKFNPNGAIIYTFEKIWGYIISQLQGTGAFYYSDWYTKPVRRVFNKYQKIYEISLSETKQLYDLWDISIDVRNTRSASVEDAEKYIMMSKNLIVNLSEKEKRMKKTNTNS